ncbi:AsmA family protein [Carboxylicivirga caseinilyticus]|uniref:AsmA family protein n=1 Tax=Carboxylicivirga caseinilyticus TaxID=3417572 RepID=UPI003D336D49|nr:hypothetical protein [Marinilabiliaceae bacterium A049]
MKLFLKTLKYLGIIIVCLIILLILIAEFAEKPITKLAINQLNETLGTELTVKNIEFSLLKDFPNAQLQLQNVQLKSDSLGLDDIIVLKNLYIEVEMTPLLHDQINIVEVRLENGVANYHVYNNQKTNIDFLIPESEENETDTTSAALNIAAPLIKTTAVQLNYKDEAENITATIMLNALSSVFMKEESGISANVEGSVTINKVNYPDTKAHLMNNMQLDLKALFQNDTLHLENASLISEGVKINTSGWINTTGNFPAELKIFETHFDLKELAKYIPDSLITDYKLQIDGGILNTSASINGDLLDTINLPQINALIKLEGTRLSALDYPSIKDLTTEISFTNGNQRSMASSELEIKKLQVKTNQSSVNLTARVINFDHPVYSFQTQANILLDEFNHLVPQDLKTNIGGRVNAALTNSGSLPDSVTMSYINESLNRSTLNLTMTNLFVEMDSVINLQNMNGSASYHNQTFQFEDISCQLPDYKMDIAPSSLKGKYIGSIDNIDQLAVDLESFDLNANKSSLSGNAYFKNGQKPYYQTKTEAEINLKDWSAFIPDTLLSDYNGQLLASIELAGSINMDSIADEAMRILFTESELLVTSKDLTIRTPDNLYNLEAMNGTVFMKNDSISMEDISGSFNQMSFTADSTYVVDLHKSVLQNQKKKVKVRGFVHLGNIDYAELEKLMPATDSTEVAQVDTIPAEPSNYSFDVRGKFYVDQLKYENAILENISGLYKLTDHEYIVDQLKFDAFKGHANTSVKVLMNNDHMKVYFKNSTHGLDINQLLVDFNDFKDYGNEDYISSEQLSGTFSTDNLSGYFLFKADTLVADSTMMTADLRLEKGQLYNYPIAVEMGKDYNIDGLDDIQFETLDNKLFIYSGTVYAPLTNIKTNTFDISLFGKQEFNLDCQYHLRFYLKEILRKGKTDRIEKKQSKESKQKDDGGTKGLTSLFAIYKVKNGETVKSTLESEGSPARTQMKIDVNLKEAMLKLQFHPLIIKYETGVEQKK